MNRKKIADVAIWPVVAIAEYCLDAVFELYLLADRIYEMRTKGKE